MAEGSTLTFRVPRSMKDRLRNETRARAMSMTRFVCEALEVALISSARRRLELIGAQDFAPVVGAPSPDAIDLTREED